MKPFSKTLGVTPELLIPLKFTCTLRRGVIQEPANIWARGGNCLSAETALIFVCQYAIRISENTASAVPVNTAFSDLPLRTLTVSSFPLPSQS